MDAFEKWYLDNYGPSNGPVSLVVKTTCEEAFRAGLRAAAEIASERGQIGPASAEGTAPIDPLAKRIVVAILAEADK